MTRFEELTDIITNNKNKHKKKEDIELEVSGAGSNPLAAWGNGIDGDMQSDPDMIDMLYRHDRGRPNRGENTSSWDSTY